MGFITYIDIKQIEHIRQDASKQASMAASFLQLC